MPTQNFFVYYRSADGHVIYSRNCGTQKEAERRVAELLRRHSEAWWQSTAYPGAFV